MRQLLTLFASMSLALGGVTLVGCAENPNTRNGGHNATGSNGITTDANGLPSDNGRYGNDANPPHSSNTSD